VAPNPDRELGEARASIDRSDERAGARSRSSASIRLSRCSTVLASSTLTTLPGQIARVCAETVPKALPSVAGVAPNPDRELGEARASNNRGDVRAALKHLDKARRGYVKRHDAAGLEHLLVLADVLDSDDERVRIGRANLVYAVKQNLRLESRRRGRELGESWQDPYPDLAAPTEHTGIAFTRGVKLAIAVGAAIGTAALVALFALPAIFGSSEEPRVTLRLLNDTQERVTVRGCDESDCFSTWMSRDIDPGLTTESSVPTDDLVELFKVDFPGRDEICLPVRVHDAVERFGETGALVARVSQATPCPGTTVLPKATVQTGL